MVDFIDISYVDHEVCDALLNTTINWEKECHEKTMGFRDDLARDKIKDYYFSIKHLRDREDCIEWEDGTREVVEIAYGSKRRANVLAEFGNIVTRKLIAYSKKYPLLKIMAFNEPWDLAVMAHLQYYAPGSCYVTWHQENTYDKARLLTWMLYLNTVEDEEEYDGGTAFYFQDRKIKAEKGKFLIWPADWTHHHRGIRAVNKEKWIVTGWADFLPNETDEEKGT